MNRIHAGWMLLVMLVPAGLRGQDRTLLAGVDQYVQAHQRQILRELVEALAIPNVAADRENIRRKAVHLVALFERRGFSARLLETAGNPLVFAERVLDKERPTLLLYCHYDGQPVDPSRWRQTSPWQPILRAGKLEEGAREIEDFLELDSYSPDWRLYARSASDDVSPILALLVAVDALKSMAREPAVNLKVILDGEEEAGSPSLAPAIEEHREELRADLMVILDGPIHPSSRPTLVFGARGILTLQLTVFGPRFPLHSGHYGNWVPNPAHLLARLLASMKDDQGRVLVEGFYEGIHFTPQEKEWMARVPDDEEALKALFGIAAPERVGENLQEARNYPSLNIRGLGSAWVGEEVRTIIPDQAVAEIDVRLVLETDPDDLYQKILAHIRRQGFRVVEEEPNAQLRAQFPKLVQVRRSQGTRAYRTPIDHPAVRPLIRALEKAWGEEPVLIRTSGGTVPISAFVQALGLPAVSLPIVNFDNNQHSPNENLRLGHFFRGIRSIAALLSLEKEDP